jgi:hypothetical protein
MTAGHLPQSFSARACRRVKLLQSVDLSSPDDASIEAINLNDEFVAGLERVRDAAQIEHDT